ncbi:HAD family hydrolase [Catenulispora subtropica]|uniref:HAD-IA family hydrolase n=1 Tax=Catenulispora subtropica TaxID=450798 RepID=A0ABN2QZE8_9ACTN
MTVPNDRKPLHLVWDWNGTVLNDFEIILRSTNASFGDHGLPAITAEQYRTQIKMPIRAFYTDILGHAPTDEEWEAMDATFHKYYVAYEREARLSTGLPDLFREWAGRGHSQSLLSMYHDDKLVPVVEHHGIAHHFSLVQGTKPPRPARKAEHLADHLRRLDAEPSRVVLIGDSPDDAAAAHSVGARVILYSGGFAAAASLRATGAPIADTLTAAVAMIEELAAEG